MAASVTLTASFPGSHVAKPFPMFLDNPEAEVTATATGSFVKVMTLTANAARRLLLVQYDDAVQILVTKSGESTAGLVPISLRTNGAALASYAMMLNGSSVDIYIK